MRAIRPHDLGPSRPRLAFDLSKRQPGRLTQKSSPMSLQSAVPFATPSTAIAVHKMESKDRQTFHESMQGQRDASITKVRAAAEALLAQLDDAQKGKARQALPGLGAGGPGEGMRHGMMGGNANGHGQGHGMGRGMGPQNKQ